MQHIIPLAVSGGVLAMLLIAGLMPWLVVNFQGKFSFTPLDVARATFNRGSPEPLDFQKGDFSSLVWNSNTYVAFSLSVLFYLMSMVLVGISIAATGSRRTFAGLGGLSAIVSTIAWIYAIESLKTQILADSRSGGPLAQLSTGFLNSIISTGTGPYLVFAAGTVGLILAFIKVFPEISRQKREDKISRDIDSVSSNPTDIQHEVKAENSYQSAGVSRIIYKSSGTAALLAFIGALFGLPGIGHIYVGRVRRGLLILFSGFALYILGWITFFGGVFGGTLGRSFPVFQTGIGLAIALILIYFGLLIWQIFDARTLAKKLNDHVQLTGKEPW